VRLEDEGEVTIGLTEDAPMLQHAIMQIELPGVGDEITRDEELGALEASDGVFDIVAPVSGKILDINDEAAENPAILIDDPHDEGWLVYVKLSDRSQWDDLLTYEEYKELHEEVEEEELEEEAELEEDEE